MMKKIFFTLLMVLAVLVMAADNTYVLKELNKPDAFFIGNDLVYVQEGTDIHIYEFKNFKYVKKFGKEGEGPGEFKINPFAGPMVLSPINNLLVVGSMAKISYFSKLGEFQKEIKTNPFETYQFIGDGFICIGMGSKKDKNQSLAYYLCDQELKNKKELYVSDLQVNAFFSFEFPMASLAHAENNKNIYINTSGEDFLITVFNKDGKPIKDIKKALPPVPVSESYKSNTMNWFKNSPSPQWKQAYMMAKDRFKFKKNFPAIFQIAAENNHIFVLTHKTKDNLRECLVLDANGKELKTVWVEAPVLYGMDFMPKFGFFQGYYYLLTENEETETWEIRQTKII